MNGLARAPLALAALALLAGAVAAQVVPQPGDLLVCRSSASGTSLLQHFRGDGTHGVDCVGAGLNFTGVTITNGGRYATASCSPNRVRMFDAAGVQVASFPTPEVLSLTGDIAVFSDGVLAVVDQSGDVECYDETGVHQGRFTVPGMGRPFGIHVDVNDHLWVCDIDAAHELYHFDRQGTLVHAYSLAFEPGDMVRDEDGTLWMVDRPARDVVHLSASCIELERFHATAVHGNLDSIGMHPDGTLYLAGETDSSVHHYSKNGVLFGSLQLGGSGAPLFLDVMRGEVLGSAYCFGDEALMSCPCGNPGGSQGGCAHSGGVGARLSASGGPSLGADDLAFQAQQLVPDQPALLFVGADTVNGGLGAHFGDGLRCAGGAVVRLGVAATDSAGNALWGPGLLAGTGWPAGDTRRFQVWFRDPGNSPCGSGSNLTNGIELVLQP